MSPSSFQILVQSCMAKKLSSKACTGLELSSSSARAQHTTHVQPATVWLRQLLRMIFEVLTDGGRIALAPEIHYAGHAVDPRFIQRLIGDGCHIAIRVQLHLDIATKDLDPFASSSYCIHPGFGAPKVSRSPTLKTEPGTGIT